MLKRIFELSVLPDTGSRNRRPHDCKDAGDRTTQNKVEGCGHRAHEDRFGYLYRVNANRREYAEKLQRVFHSTVLGQCFKFMC